MSGILIHGCHVQADDWRGIVFGHKQKWGRVPTAIKEAIDRNATLIFWGSGASQKNGFKESEYTFAESLGPELEKLAERVHQKSEPLKNYLKQVSVIDRGSQNTAEEIQSALKSCEKKGIKELILVSSPTHIARCLQEACKIREKGSMSIKIYATPSDTSFAGATASDVVVLEYHHRGDRPKVNFLQPARRLFQFLQDEETAKLYISAWNRLTDRMELILQNALRRRAGLNGSSARVPVPPGVPEDASSLGWFRGPRRRIVFGVVPGSPKTHHLWGGAGVPEDASSLGWWGRVKRAS